MQTQQQQEMAHEYALRISAGSLLLAEELTRLESWLNRARRRKKERVLEKKRAMLREAFPTETAQVSLETEAHTLLSRQWPQNEALTFIIDLAFSNPFAPYELSFKEKDFEKALGKIAPLVGLTAEDVKRVRQTQKQALKAHGRLKWGRIALWGVGGLLIIGTGGWLLAPAIGTAVGSATGLYGIAATSHGLAILGGGSLAIGGAGMAGGMWVVTGTGAALGLLGAGGTTLLLELGAAQAKVELVKLQVSYKEVILGTQSEIKKAQEVITSLTQQRDEINQRLAEERDLNEKNARRIKEMEATLEALEHSLGWIESTYAAGDHPQLKSGQKELI